MDSQALIEISLSSLVVGTKYRGEFEERLEAVVREAFCEPKPILFIDEIHLLLGAGSASGRMDAANILKPALARGAIRVIGATTNREYRQTIEKDGALERWFQGGVGRRAERGRGGGYFDGAAAEGGGASRVGVRGGGAAGGGGMVSAISPGFSPAG